MKQAIGFTLAALVIFALVPLLARGSAAPAPITAFPTGSTEAEPSGTEALQPPEVQSFDETFFLPVLEDDSFPFLEEEELPEGYRVGELVL